jgi:uncharacterized BrkB/YihY/UPF0761 family membrane protein
MMTLSKRIFFVAFNVFCIVYTLLCMQLEVGDFSTPGPGFVPVFLGVVGTVLSSCLTVQAFRQTLEKKEGNDEDKTSLIRLGLYVLVCFAFLPMFDFLGSLISVFILVLLLSKISGLKKWWKSTVLGLATSAFFYCLFAMVLQVPLPQGLISFI